jgi:para-nitrobenzyl esterase
MRKQPSEVTQRSGRHHRRRLAAGSAVAVVAAALLPGAAFSASTPSNTATSAGSAKAHAVRGADHHPARRGVGSLVVQTDKGAVRGVRTGAVDSFLGIRYAAPPQGELRWRPPRPAAAWPGVKRADAYGNRCPAAASTNGPRSETEDCLFVNLQRPVSARRGHRRPVYVFIHGGGLVNGSSNQADMQQLVARTHVVGVSFNYRLGVLGFLAHPGLTREGGESGNYGLMDQQAALRWVQRNIAAFGGDPARVTLGGESSGGWSVCAHLSAPGSAGLFAQAMLQSGSCPSQTQAQGERTGSAVAAAVGCADAATAVSCLRHTPVGQLIDAPSTGFPAPVRGTPFLPMDPREAVATGQFARVPVVIGANRDEGRTFTVGNVGWTREQYTDWVHQTFGPHADDVLARYPWPVASDRFTGAYLSGAILTDAGLVVDIGGCPNRTLTQDFARHTRTYAYEFNHRTGPGLQPEPAGYEWGAGHAAELAYLFPSFDNGTPIAPTFNAAERQLATDMKRYWGAFASTGTPHVPGQAAWPLHDARRYVLSLQAGGDSVAISDAALSTEHQCSFWDTLPIP